MIFSAINAKIIVNTYLFFILYSYTHNGKQDDRMTDKELRKLSRLELLELLLKESSENQKLREELNKLKSENKIEKTAERLTETADNLDSSIQNIETIIQNLIADKNTESAKDSKAESETEVIEETETTDTPESDILKQKKNSEDADIYRRFMQFFYYNRNNLVFLPDDLRKDVTRRLSEIMENAQSKKSDDD